MNCKDCTIRKFYAKQFDMHFDWLDCPYHCEYGDKMLADFEASGCKTVKEWKELRGE